MDKKKKGRPKNKAGDPTKRIISHYQSSKGDYDPAFSPKDSSEVIGNPVASNINPAKLIESEKKQNFPKKSTLKINPKASKPTNTGLSARSKPNYSEDDWGTDAMRHSDFEGEVSMQLNSGGDMAEQKQDRWLVGAATFFSLAACIMVAFSGVWIFKQTQKDSNRTQEMVRQEQDTVKSLAAQVKGGLESMAALEQETKAYQSNLQALKADIEAAQAQLIGLSGKQDWVLNEAFYLAKSADVQLKVNQDIHTAQLQLEAADRRIKSLGYPQLSWVRGALAKDIATLKDTPMLDKHGLWAQLDAVSSRLYHLKFKALVDKKIDEPELPKQNVAKEMRPRWQENFIKSWDEFKSLIRVSRYDQEVIQPVLTGLEQNQLLRSMTLIIEEAKWGVLKEDSIIYHESLNKLQQMVPIYFEETRAQETLLVSLAELSKLSLLQQLPDINNSLMALKKALEQSSVVPDTQETAS